RHIAGLQSQFRKERFIPARLTRNVASAQGRVDYVRVEMKYENGENMAEPVLGKSGMIRTMVGADGLIGIPRDTEGLDAGAIVKVIPF
ncbi:MAG TPA: hypothetical protein VJ904_14280, partial [Tichowtungia sp.]|nr:hypothetical protein [Tichowtungia sp.]